MERFTAALTNATTQRRNCIDIHNLESRWTPEDVRVQRSRNRGLRVRSLNRNSNPLCAGDFILSQYNDATTISFCFTLDSNNYGLTVAHLADHTDENGEVIERGAVGDKLFAFDSDEPPPSTGEYATVEIGTIVSMDRGTDSLVFQVHKQFRIMPLCVPAQLGMTHPFQLPLDSFSPPHEVAVGTIVAGFGAMRRGMVGRVSISVNTIPDIPGMDFLFLGDLGVCSFDPADENLDHGEKQLTDGGDCGMLLFDEHGTAWSMHRALFESAEGNTFISFSTPLRNILAGHPEFFREARINRQASPLPTVTVAGTTDTTTTPRPAVKENIFQAALANGRFIKTRTHFKTKLTDAAPFLSNMAPVKHRLNVKTRIVHSGPYRGADKGR